MENGLVPSRSDMFPAGLRVLVVDDDPTWLKILEKMLKKCSYEVTTCCLATDALDMLRKRKEGFDIVISDVNMPDMDGFKLLEHVGLEMNLPVIMMSVDGEINRVMKGVLHGACDYLLKPIRMKELQNIWQHVVRKKIHEVKDLETHEGSESIQKMRNGLDAFDDSHLLAGGDLASARRRKDLEYHGLDDQDFSDSSAAKKARVVWSIDLHQKFVSAVNHIGLDIGPKKILDLMNVPWLTRENVASHLQKYRLYLSRLQKQNEPSFGATTQPDFSSMDPSSSFNIQSSTVMHQNNSASCSFGYFGKNMLVQDVSPEVQEVSSKVPFLPVTKSRKALTVDVPYMQKMDNGSRIELANSSGSGKKIKYTLFEPSQPTTPQQHSWGGASPMIQFTKQPKEEQSPPRYPSCQKQHIQADPIKPASSVNFGTSTSEADKVGPSEMKPWRTVYGNSHVRTVSPTSHTVKAQTNAVSAEIFDCMSTSIISPSTKCHSFDQFLNSNLGTQQLNFVSGPILVSPHEDVQLCSLQDHAYVENVGFNNLEFSDYLGPELITDIPSHLNDGLRFNSDYLFDSIEYSTIAEGLFIT